MDVNQFSEAERKQRVRHWGRIELLVMASSVIYPGTIRAPANRRWVEASFRQLLRDDRAFTDSDPLRELARRWIGAMQAA